MFHKRVIPQLLINKGKLVKTEQFNNPIYIGDPINTSKIFNEKEVDELNILDIGATRFNYPINFELIERLASECFMPISYGGGIRNFEDAAKVLRSGVEKIVIQSAFLNNPTLIDQIADVFGAQSIIISLDFERIKNNYRVYRRKKYFWPSKRIDPQIILQKLSSIDFGELQLTSVTQEGTMNGLDIGLIELFKGIKKPIILCGGAKSMEDIKNSFDFGASAVGVGRLFTLHGPMKAVLIDYPNREILKNIL